MKTFQVISPVDGSVYVEREYSTATQIESILANAKVAQKMWKNVPLREQLPFAKGP